MHLKRFAQQKPVQMAAAILLVIVALRLLDVFVIRSDEIFGEQYLTKVVGMILVFGYAWYVKGDWSSIGFGKENWGVAMLLGAAIMGVALLIGYGVEWFLLVGQNAVPRLFVSPQGLSLTGDAAGGGLALTVSLLVGNLVNSFMEEGLFRGVLITHLGSRMALWKANLIQAGIFGVWHIVWPARDYLDGKMDAGEAIGIAVGYAIISGLIGFAWGYFYQKTNTLWVAWAAHTVNNSTMNLVHITTAAGDPSTLGLRVAVATLIVAAAMPLVKRVAAARGWPEAARWGEG